MTDEVKIEDQPMPQPELSEAEKQVRAHEAEAALVDDKLRKIASEHTSIVVACSCLGAAAGLFSALIEAKYVDAQKIGNLYGQAMYLALRPVTNVVEVPPTPSIILNGSGQERPS